MKWKGIYFASSQSAKLIFLVIRIHGPLSQKKLISITGISERTVRYSLSRLTSLELIEEKMNGDDLREKLYIVRSELE